VLPEEVIGSHLRWMSMIRETEKSDKVRRRDRELIAVHETYQYYARA